MLTELVLFRTAPVPALLSHQGGVTYSSTGDADVGGTGERLLSTAVMSGLLFFHLTRETSDASSDSAS